MTGQLCLRITSVDLTKFAPQIDRVEIVSAPNNILLYPNDSYSKCTVPSHTIATAWPAYSEKSVAITYRDENR